MSHATRLDAQDTDGGVVLSVKIVPGASRTKLVGLLDGALKIAVAAPPEKGRANQALIKHLAELLAVQRNRICIQKGQTSPHKIILIEGINKATLLDRLQLEDGDSDLLNNS